MAIHYVHPVHRELARAWRAHLPAGGDDVAAPVPIQVDLAAAVNEAWDKGLDMEYPWQLPCDSLLSLGWDGGPGCSSSNGFSVCTLPTGVRVYFGLPDWENLRALAAFVGNAERGDAAFVRELLRTNGAAYGTNVMWGPPSDGSLSPSLRLGEWRELFLACCNVAADGNPEFWEEVPDLTAPDDTRITCSHPLDRGCEDDWCDERRERWQEARVGDWITSLAGCEPRSWGIPWPSGGRS